jgi:hypothetical protein
MQFFEMTDRQLTFAALASILWWQNETAQSETVGAMIEELKARAEQPEEDE